MSFNYGYYDRLVMVPAAALKKNPALGSWVSDLLGGKSNPISSVVNLVTGQQTLPVNTPAPAAPPPPPAAISAPATAAIGSGVVIAGLGIAALILLKK